MSEDIFDISLPDEEDEGYAETFDLEQFFADLQIESTKEQKVITKCFGKGLETYYEFIYGYHKYGKNPDWLISERMHEPYILGFGTVQTIRSAKLSVETKLKIANYTLQQTNPTREYGTPYGLIMILSLAAQHKVLPLDAFRMTMQVMQIERHWQDGWKADEAIHLSDWILSHEEMPSEEKIWWLWHITTRLNDNAHMGKTLVKHWLDHPDLSNESKQKLCWGWLTKEKQVGTPPPTWRVSQAQAVGDFDAAGQALRDLGLPENEIEQAIAEMQKAMSAVSSDVFRFLSDPIHDFDPAFTMIFMPGWLKRVAIPALVRLGEEPLDVCTLFLDQDRKYGAEAVNMGVADTIATYSDQLPPEEVRRLIEKGIQIPQVNTRKTFYRLSTQFYGTELLQKTQTDNAVSVRKWGAKELNKLEAKS